jgi:ligand-binding SRPBCC domain-containing protein
MLQTLKTSQLLNSDIKQVWDFMSNPSNLALITPTHMGFQIVGNKEEVKMYPGQIIEYFVSPIAGIKMHWVTEITHVKEGEYFVDEQRFGPYSFWHHKHFMKETATGVLMEDIVHYKVPMGPIGDFINSIFIRGQLKKIFDYRFIKLEVMFNKK